MFDVGNIVVRHAVNLGIKGVTEDVAQFFRKDFGFSSLCGVEDRCFDTSGKSSSEKLGGELHGTRKNGHTLILTPHEIPSKVNYKLDVQLT